MNVAGTFRSPTPVTQEHAKYLWLDYFVRTVFNKILSPHQLSAGIEITPQSVRGDVMWRTGKYMCVCVRACVCIQERKRFWWLHLWDVLCLAAFNQGVSCIWGTHFLIMFPSTLLNWTGWFMFALRDYRKRNHIGEVMMGNQILFPMIKKS